MKTLSVKQPYAALIAAGLKPFEIRTWQTQYRGELLIHAGKDRHQHFESISVEERTLTLEWFTGLSTNEFSPSGWKQFLSFGSLICVVDLVDIRLMTKDDEPKAFCPFIPGAFAWVLENPRLVEPFAMSGKLSLFETPNEIIKFI